MSETQCWMCIVLYSLTCFKWVSCWCGVLGRIAVNEFHKQPFVRVLKPQGYNNIVFIFCKNLFFIEISIIEQRSRDYKSNGWILWLWCSSPGLKYRKSAKASHLDGKRVREEVSCVLYWWSLIFGWARLENTLCKPNHIVNMTRNTKRNIWGTKYTQAYWCLPKSNCIFSLIQKEWWHSREWYLST